MTSHRPTLKTIAARAGCSKQTVSLALRHAPDIPASTRTRIEQIALELGYRPDPNLLALMAHVRSRSPARFQAVIAVLHTVTREFALATPAYAEWLMGAADHATQLGFSIDDFWLADEPISARHFQKTLRTRGVRGLLLPCWANAPPLGKRLRPILARYPCAILGYPDSDFPPLPLATNDRFATGTLLLERAAEAGYRRIGLVVMRGFEPRGERRFAAAIAHGLGQHPGLAALPVLECDSDGRDEFLQWFRKNRPDCIITSAPEVWAWLAESGVRIPEEAGFLFWQVEERDEAHKDWSGMSQNDRQIGATGLDLIATQLRCGEHGVPPVHSRTMIESTFVRGRTIRAMASPDRSLQWENDGETGRGASRLAGEICVLPVEASLSLNDEDEGAARVTSLAG